MSNCSRRRRHAGAGPWRRLLHGSYHLTVDHCFTRKGSEVMSV